jgi:hypothetical protein
VDRATFNVFKKLGKEFSQLKAATLRLSGLGRVGGVMRGTCVSGRRWQRAFGRQSLTLGGLLVAILDSGYWIEEYLAYYEVLVFDLLAVLEGFVDSSWWEG